MFICPLHAKIIRIIYIVLHSGFIIHIRMMSVMRVIIINKGDYSVMFLISRSRSLCRLYDWNT